jgi:hypothetical protein
MIGEFVPYANMRRNLVRMMKVGWKRRSVGREGRLEEKVGWKRRSVEREGRLEENGEMVVKEW